MTGEITGVTGCDAIIMGYLDGNDPQLKYFSPEVRAVWKQMYVQLVDIVDWDDEDNDIQQWSVARITKYHGIWTEVMGIPRSCTWHYNGKHSWSSFSYGDITIEQSRNRTIWQNKKGATVTITNNSVTIDTADDSSITWTMLYRFTIDADADCMLIVNPRLHTRVDPKSLPRAPDADPVDIYNHWRLNKCRGIPNIRLPKPHLVPTVEWYDHYGMVMDYFRKPKRDTCNLTGLADLFSEK